MPPKNAEIGFGPLMQPGLFLRMHRHECLVRSSCPSELSAHEISAQDLANIRRQAQRLRFVLFQLSEQSAF